ncbi:MAG: fumarylacetoacetate hydrolase family protein [Rhizobiaceae bacterium]|nr:fumarylacetoacetate hydrolase family protein [Rhizobiaceae bacterium]
MKLATYFDNGPKLGLVDSSYIWDLRSLTSLYLFEKERLPNCREIAEALVPHDMAMFIRIHHQRTGYFRDMLEVAKQEEWSGLSQAVDSVRLLPPVLAPARLVGCGSSYRGYLVEMGYKPTEGRWPKDVKMSFLKHPSALVGHNETIFFPEDSKEWDYENELAIVIGKLCSDVSERDAANYIFGYSIFNDACVRDLPSWTNGLDSPHGKAGDFCGPCGPWIVPAEFLGKDPNNLDFTTHVDDELRQKSNTSDMLFPVERFVAAVSRHIRLGPGDIIITGSTKGNAHTTGKFLKVGQVVRCEMEQIGVLENMIGKKKWKSVLEPLPEIA